MSLEESFITEDTPIVVEDIIPSSPNTVRTAAVGFPKVLALTDAIMLLDQVLTKMQNDGSNILSTEHLGDNIFQIEFREGS